MVHGVYPGPDPDPFQNLIDWSFAKDLSFYKIWFKSVSNFLRYPYSANSDTHAHRREISQ